MTVYLPKNSRFWHYDFQYKRRRYHGSTGVETRRAAEGVERRLRHQAAEGTLGDASDMTWDMAAGRWWSEVGMHRRSARQLEHRLEIATRLVGADTPLRDITTALMSVAIERRRGESYQRAEDRPATRDQAARRAVRHALKNATVNADVVKPVQRVLNRARKVWGVPGLPEIAWGDLLLPEPEPEIRIYSDEQRRAWADRADPTSRFALQLLLTYGLRFGELFFPLDAFIPDTPDGPVLAINKRKKGVLLMPLIAADARQIAARVGRARAAGLDSIWIEGRPGRKVVAVTYAALQSRLRAAGRRAGLDMPRLIHGARHHVGTTTLAATGDIKLVQQLLGHADIKSTLRYAHAQTQRLRAALESRNSPEGHGPEAEFSLPDQPVRRNRS